MKKTYFFKIGCFLLNFLAIPLGSAAQDEQDSDPFTCVDFFTRQSEVYVQEQELGLHRVPSPQGIESLTPSMDFFARGSDGSYLLRHKSNLTELDIQALTYNGYLTLTDIARGVPFENMSNILDIFKDRGESWGSEAFFGMSGWRNSSEPKDMDKFLAKLETIVGVVWALCHHSFRQGEGFYRGSFSIIDPQGHFWAFLQEALKTLGQAETLNELTNLSSLSSAALNCLGSDRAYRRLSSHYTNEQCFFTQNQFGIDTRFSKSCYPIPCLPFGMSHILMGNVQNGDLSKIFFKFEPYGLVDLFNVLNHTLEYFRSPEVNHMMKREKDIPEGVAEKTYNLFEVLKRLKEEEIKKLPEGVRRTLEEYNNKNTGVDFFKESKNLDISTLWSWCQQGMGQDYFKVLLEQIKVQLLCFYKEETLPWRTGNERVLDFDQFAVSRPEDFGLNSPILVESAFHFFEEMIKYADQIKGSHPSFYSVLSAYSALTYLSESESESERGEEKSIDAKLCFLSCAENVTIEKLWELCKGFNGCSQEIQALLTSLEAALNPLLIQQEGSQGLEPYNSWGQSLPIRFIS